MKEKLESSFSSIVNVGNVGVSGIFVFQFSFFIFLYLYDF